MTEKLMQATITAAINCVMPFGIVRTENGDIIVSLHNPIYPNLGTLILGVYPQEFIDGTQYVNVYSTSVLDETRISEMVECARDDINHARVYFPTNPFPQ